MKPCVLFHLTQCIGYLELLTITLIHGLVGLDPYRDLGVPLGISFLTFGVILIILVILEARMTDIPLCASLVFNVPSAIVCVTISIISFMGLTYKNPIAAQVALVVSLTPFILSPPDLYYTFFSGYEVSNYLNQYTAIGINSFMPYTFVTLSKSIVAQLVALSFAAGEFIYAACLCGLMLPLIVFCFRKQYTIYILRFLLNVYCVLIFCSGLVVRNPTPIFIWSSLTYLLSLLLNSLLVLSIYELIVALSN